MSRSPVVALALAFAVGLLTFPAAGVPTAGAQSASVRNPPLPVGRPDPEARLPEEEPEGDASDYTPGQTLAAPEASVEGADPLPPVYERLAETDLQFSECTEALNELGASFEVLEPITTAKIKDCGIARPIEVAEIVPGVALRPETVLRCATARALASWVNDFVMPAAKQLPDRGALEAIAHGSSYICRTRNNAASGKLSEHSFGNAIDVMGFTFEDGSTLRIEPREDEGTLLESFQSAVRKAACLHFTTVLGPGTDRAHANHLHLDIKMRKGGYRLCQ